MSHMSVFGTETGDDYSYGESHGASSYDHDSASVMGSGSHSHSHGVHHEEVSESGSG